MPPDVTAPTTTGQPTTDPPTAGLSGRERENVASLAGGATDAQIAEQLFVSVNSASHLERIRYKTGARRRTELARYAQRTGIESVVPRD